MSIRSIIFATSALIICTGASADIYKRKKPKPPVFSYDAEWVRVDSLEQKGLPKSAMDVVQGIRTRAKAEHNDPNFVKAMGYTVRLQEMLDEHYINSIYNDFNAEIGSAGTPVKQILKSLIAKALEEYYQRNNWQLKQNNNTEGGIPELWTSNQFRIQITSYYNGSIEDAAILRTVPLDNYALALYNKDNYDIINNLYELLLHRALNAAIDKGYNTEDESYELPEASMTFSHIPDFLKHSFESPSDPNNVYRSLQLYQAMLKEQVGRNNITGIIYYDLERINYASGNSKNYSREMNMAYWQYLLDTYRQHPASNTVAAKIATAMLYSEKPERAKALTLCREAIARYPDAQANDELRNLIRTILSKSLNIQTERSVKPETSALLSVRYSNIRKAYLYYVPVDYDTWHSGSDSLTIEKLIGYDNKSPRPSQEIALPDYGDYTEHSAELLMPASAKGFYAVIATNTPDWRNNDTAIIVYTTYWSSGLWAYLHPEGKVLTDDNNMRILTVLDAEQGTPVEGAEVIISRISSHYNEQTFRYETEREIAQRLRTQPDGSILFEFNKDNYYNTSFEFDIRNGSDRFVISNTRDNYYYYNNTEKEQVNTYLFTDRAIYRPGQTVYFKTITVRRRGRNQETLANQGLKLQLHDPNSEVLASLDGLSNNFGSYSDSFTLPKSGVISGQYAIRCNGIEEVYFSVEEYKRPKYEITGKPITGIYKLNDQVSVTALAKTFSGIPVSGAKVVYSVTRDIRYPYYSWDYWGRSFMPYPSSAFRAITNGTLTTDDSGHFTISFKAVPDESIQKSHNPYFDFRVNAVVTDLNGETHEYSQYITMAYSDRDISMEAPAVHNSSKPLKVILKSSSIQGSNIPHNGRLIVERLRSMSISRTRLWDMPDTILTDRSTFKAAFPDMAYSKQETMPQPEALVFTQNLDNSTAAQVTLKTLLNVPNGTYRITMISPDGMGGELKREQLIHLYTPASGKVLNSDVLLATDIGASKYEPGQTCKILLSTSAPSLYVKYVIMTGNSVNSIQYTTLKQGSTIISIPVTEAQRGNFSVQFFATYHYRSYNPSVSVSVPYTNKELRIGLKTMRDKLAPGQKDKWTMTISGSKAEKVAAEMMAVMYDESLDQFNSHSWYLNVWPDNYAPDYFGNNDFSAYNSIQLKYSYLPYYPTSQYLIPDFSQYSALLYNGGNISFRAHVAYAWDFGDTKNEGFMKMSEPGRYDLTVAADEREKVQSEPAAPPAPAPVIRKNFSETAFFYPQLRTDAAGSISFEFTIPEALTRWKFMALAHTGSMAAGVFTHSVVTQKDFMVSTDLPRFLRTGDRITIASKLSNISTRNLAGEAWIEVLDAATGRPAAEVTVSAVKIPVSIKAKSNTAVSWQLNIPETHQALTLRIVARCGNMSDGEEMTIPVLSNKIHITESMPISIRRSGEKKFTFEHLKQQSSTTLVNDKVVVEVTSNPAWYAVQALPYMMEYPYECAEQTFNRFYADAIAIQLANRDPQVQQVYDSWVKAAEDSRADALLSNLQKNEDLKSLILEETPWVAEAKNENERKKQLGRLFNSNAMSERQQASLKKLEEAQLQSGGWAWFKGMHEDLYITQYIIAGFGHLNNAGIDISAQVPMIEKALAWMDHHARTRYLLATKPSSTVIIGPADIQYLYARSFFPYIALSSENKEALDYWIAKAENSWNGHSRHEQAMTALALKRLKPESSTPADIIKSLKEFAQNTEEMGMYWKDNLNGWRWYEAPVETQAILIEAFREVANDQSAVTDMQIWLLRNKQSNNWASTKATADACYALLSNGNTLLSQSAPVKVSIGGKNIVPENTEAGTGYFRTDIPADQISTATAEISLSSIEDKLSYGAVHWQYFEQLDKITQANTNLQITKTVFRTVNSSSGPKLEEVTAATILHVGDKLNVRLTLTSDRDMEYVHLKDMRGSGTEPQSVLSGYHYNNGLAYYMSTRDASTNFFIDHLYKGTYTIDYNIVVQQKGQYSNGIASVQCMYAPEFNAHSSGIMLKVE